MTIHMQKGPFSINFDILTYCWSTHIWLYKNNNKSVITSVVVEKLLKKHNAKFLKQIYLFQIVMLFSIFQLCSSKGPFALQNIKYK